MMAIQNFGFFTMYYDIWGDTPFSDTCGSTRYAVGMMALTCFCVAFLCVGMGYGGYIDSKLNFTLFWFAHLVGGSMYTACTVIVPLARWSDEALSVPSSPLSMATGSRLFTPCMPLCIWFTWEGCSASPTSPTSRTCCPSFLQFGSSCLLPSFLAPLKASCTP